MTRQCAPIIGTNANDVLRTLLWPLGSKRGSLQGLLVQGSKGGPITSLARLTSDRIKEYTEVDLALEAYFLGEHVHIGHTLNATVFGPIHEPPANYQLKSLLGAQLNVHKSFTAESAGSWIENEVRKQSRTELLPALRVFEFDQGVPIKEILDVTSIRSTRIGGRNLYNRLSELNEEEREEEVAKLNGEFAKWAKRKSDWSIGLDTADIILSLASLTGLFYWLPFVGLYNLGSGRLERLRRSKKIDDMMLQLESRVIKDSRRKELSFLSRIERVASLKRVRV